MSLAAKWASTPECAWECIGLLADESLHVEPQLVVLDQRQRLLEYLDEELLARGQQQVQHIEDVRGERLVGHVVERQLRPVEVDVARLEDESLVVERRVMRTRCLVIDGEHREPFRRISLYDTVSVSRHCIGSRSPLR